MSVKENVTNTLIGRFTLEQALPSLNKNTLTPVSWVVINSQGEIQVDEKDFMLGGGVMCNDW